MTDVMYHTVISGSCLRNRGYVSNRDVSLCMSVSLLSLVHTTFSEVLGSREDETDKTIKCDYQEEVEVETRKRPLGTQG